MDGERGQKCRDEWQKVPRRMRIYSVLADHEFFRRITDVARVFAVANEHDDGECAEAAHEHGEHDDDLAGRGKSRGGIGDGKSGCSDGGDGFEEEFFEGEACFCFGEKKGGEDEDGEREEGH